MINSKVSENTTVGTIPSPLPLRPSAFPAHPPICPCVPILSTQPPVRSLPVPAPPCACPSSPPIRPCVPRSSTQPPVRALPRRPTTRAASPRHLATRAIPSRPYPAVCTCAVARLIFPGLSPFTSPILYLRASTGHLPYTFTFCAFELAVASCTPPVAELPSCVLRLSSCLSSLTSPFLPLASCLSRLTSSLSPLPSPLSRLSLLRCRMQRR